MCKDCWFSKYNKVLLHYSVSMAAARGCIDVAAAAVVVVVEGGRNMSLWV
jgi:hypothetical protein